ncbi:MAG TPA: endonuclease III domain-containing protein [Dehalococcoidia bacterium]|nr:endonuclease III domain-containing protein [Dehalococcoidia bacterium]
MAKLKQHKKSEGTAHNARSLNRQLTEIYRILLARYGPQHWWPADTAFEVIVGAILTQSAAWGNVEKAISNLKQAGVMTPASLRNLPLGKLAKLIYPSGYYNAKALKLKSFLEYLKEAHEDSLEKLFSLDIHQLRSELLNIHGIGPETADSIILYAAHKPIFVIDAYTRRILNRLGLNPSRDSYADFQAIFMGNLPADEKLFNEYHALLVQHGKEVCKKTPLCDDCCLKQLCLYYSTK